MSPPGRPEGEYRSAEHATARRAVAAALLVATATAFAAPDAPAIDAWRVQIEGWVRRGFEDPDEALRNLRDLQRAPPASRGAPAQVLAAIGLVEARAGQAADAEASARALAAMPPALAAGFGTAAATLVRAEAAFTAGKVDVAADFARQSLAATLARCPAQVLAPSPAPALPARADTPACEWRWGWAALLILERRAETAGSTATATAHAESALRLVEWAGDPARQGLALVALAKLAEERGDRGAADRLLARARRVAAQPPDRSEQARLDSTEATLLSARGDYAAALAFRERAVALAEQAGAQRLQAQMLTNLGDTYTRLGRPAEALEATGRALAIVRSRRDLRAERALINNAGIAKIALGRIAEGKQDLARVLDLWRSSGEAGRQAETLREYGEALAAAGEPREALGLYHRERAISDALMMSDRAVALKELQTRNAADARQRDIELLARESALKTEALANRDLLQMFWALLVALLLLACGCVYLLYRRVRRTHGRLVASRAELQSQSERDPLTNLANRRHFDAAMGRLAAAPGGFAGALLLVDIDHFKRVNDVHGHAGGDQALVEVAQRLAAAVRAGDVVVRWGGEEFLVLAPQATAEQAEQMAARILASVGSTPVLAGGRALTVTVSIGHASFPLAAGAAPVDAEQAVGLADQALLAAKRFGRNRAVGVESTAAAGGTDVGALVASQAAFAAAWQAGGVALRQTPGPARPALDAAEEPALPAPRPLPSAR